MKIYFKTFGCRVNQIETESLREKMLAVPGNSEADSPITADCIVLNTCSVTSRADRDALVFLRRTAEQNPECRIFVSGCLSELSPQKVKKAAPSAVIFSNSEKEKIASAACGMPFPMDFSTVTGFYGRSRAFVKIQDGCNLKCSYCLVNMARNVLRSKPLETAVNEVRGLINSGFGEIVLCGTRLGFYHCPDTGADLNGLMRRIFALPGRFRIRFSSMEITELKDSLIKTLSEAGDRFCNYFHLPLQSGSDAVLKAMNRPYDTARYADMVERLRGIFPEAGIYADIIVGFPSETDADFENSMEFVKINRLSGLHIFSYSSRPGTKAALMKQIPHNVIKERSVKLHKTDLELRSGFAESQKGKTLQTLVLGSAGSSSQGLTSNFITVELDGVLDRGIFVPTVIESVENGTVKASIRKDSY